MLLAVDIGNSNINIGVFDGETLRMRAKLSSAQERSADEYAALFYDMFRIRGVERAKLTGCIIASVVPALTGLVEEAIRSVTGLTAMKVGPGIRTGFRIAIDDPSQLGADLVANTAAALADYGAPLILVDVGTVITIAAVDSDRCYQGVCIVPGLYAGAELLKSSTALLPSITLEPVGRMVLGKNSADAMRCGLLCGNAMMVDGFVDRFRTLPKMAGARVIATGGTAELITAGCRHNVTCDSDLTLRGLRRLYQLNTVKKL